MLIDTAFFIHQAIKSLILPPGLFVVIAAFGLLWRRNLVGKAMLVSGPLLLYLFSTAPVTAQLARFVERHPPLSIDQARAARADAILVLMAGRVSNAAEWEGADVPNPPSMARLTYAAHLHRMTGLPLIISGGLALEGRPSLAQLADRALREHFRIAGALLEERSRDTWQNAEFSAQLLQARGLRRVLVVTHATHMHRAMFSLQRFGVEAIPAPIHSFTYPQRDAAPTLPQWLSWLPSGRAFSNNTTLLHEIIGMVWYRHARD